jgi:hypothetical protein
MRTSSPKRDLVFSGLALAALALGVVVAPVHAELITYTTPAGATNPVSGQPVDATATFTTSTDQIVVVLNNLIVNPTDVSQNISDLFFTVSTGQTSGTINQGLSSGTSRTVAGDGSFTDNGTVSPTHWALQTSGSQLLLNDLTGGQPNQTIIGSPGAGNTYSSANGSIAGNGPHNPFLFGPVSFTLSVAGVTDSSTITAATFSFGTVAGQNVEGVAAVPEASTATVAVFGAVACLAYGWSRHRREQRRQAAA